MTTDRLRADGVETARPGAGPPALVATKVTKTFSGTTVLKGVDLEVRSGEVHGLVGENGSGKSTFIKVLAGYHAPDDIPETEIVVHGESLPLPLDPDRQRRRGVVFVHQDLGLVESATVTENIRLRTRRVRPGWRVSWREENRHVASLLARFGLDVAPGRPVAELSQVQRAQVAIVRAFDQLGDATRGLLVLDEPTASLPRDGVDQLFATVRQVAATGVGVLLVTHRLEEILDHTQRVTVFRNGSVVECAPTASLDEAALTELILGQPLDEFYPAPHEPREEVIAEFVEVQGSDVRPTSFTVHRGEVVGVTGLIGMGWDELPYLLFGARRATGGVIRTASGGQTRLRSLTPRQAMGLGFALLPADRLVEASVQSASVRENLSIATVGRYFRRGRVRRRLEAARVGLLLDEYDVRPRGTERPLSTLSGGNQQKVLIAKWFETEPELLLLHEPTQGVDVGAQSQIYQRIRDAVRAGLGVVLASAEYEHLPHICDRVLVFREGQVVSELSGQDMNRSRIAGDCLRPSTEPR
ncbi:sugar ABC transporter ATP-binding protein [Streptomyces naphthomycinicus]|uniref:sugar ABC transporter ATP-binding protein n=1 Tax=Streptomyces naphthomycinicus TaxID=2872625 RepID=UPI001CED73A5|nr:sugar ABC transporter ATP-binding protein [Streptomyces sp. TML10]